MALAGVSFKMEIKPIYESVGALLGPLSYFAFLSGIPAGLRLFGVIS